jgi:hypothetical protein
MSSKIMLIMMTIPRRESLSSMFNTLFIVASFVVSVHDRE